MKFAPISIYDVSAWQAWLEDEAAKGNFLDGPGRICTFESGEPKAVRYRMEPVGRRPVHPDEETREVYRDMGWNYVDTAGRTFYIWRCDDPNAPELNTDPQVQAAAYERLLKQLKWADLVIILVWLAIAVMVLLFHLRAEDYALRLMQNWEPWYTAWPLFLAVGVIIPQTIYWEWSLRRYVGGLRAGVPQPQRRPYRLSRVLAVVTLVIYSLFLVSRLAVIAQPNYWTYEPVSTFEETVPCVELPTLGEVKAIRWKNWRTREQWWTLQGDWDDSYAESRYYDFYAPWSAKRMARLLAERDDLRPVEVPDLDAAWLGEHSQYGMQLLVLRQGTVVLEVEYSGSDDVTEHLEVYAALLTGGGAI